MSLDLNMSSGREYLQRYLDDNAKVMCGLPEDGSKESLIAMASLLHNYFCSLTGFLSLRIDAEQEAKIQRILLAAQPGEDKGDGESTAHG